MVRWPDRLSTIRTFGLVLHAPRDSNPEPADCSSQIIAPRAFLWTVFGMHSHAISTRDTSQLTCQGTLRHRGQVQGDHSGWLKPAELISITCRDPMVELMGIEPTTPCLQSRCSSQLSYSPGTGTAYGVGGPGHPQTIPLLPYSGSVTEPSVVRTADGPAIRRETTRPARRRPETHRRDGPGLRRQLRLRWRRLLRCRRRGDHRW